MDAPNPYIRPGSVLSDQAELVPAKLFAPGSLHLGWIAVFLFNMVVPLFFGWDLAGPNGRIGMFAAASVLFGAGYWICSVHRDLARLFVKGGVIVGLSQIYPLLQIVAGLGGMVVGQLFRQVSSGDSGPPMPLSQAGGFIVTLTTGALLMLASTALGYLAQTIRQRKWWQRWRRRPSLD